MPHLSRILAALCLTAALTACGVHDPPVTVTAAAPLRHSHPWVDAPEQTSPVAVPDVEERAFATRPSRAEPTTTTTTAPPVSAPPAPRVAPPPQPRVDAAAAPPPAAQGSPRDIARTLNASRGWDAEWSCLDELWTHESGWDPTEDGGIPQAKPASKMASEGDDWRTNPVTQIRWGLGYIAVRYGSPCAALRSWWANPYPHWY